MSLWATLDNQRPCPYMIRASYELSSAPDPISATELPVDSAYPARPEIDRNSGWGIAKHNISVSLSFRFPTRMMTAPADEAMAGKSPACA